MATQRLVKEVHPHYTHYELWVSIKGHSQPLIRFTSDNQATQYAIEHGISQEFELVIKGELVP